MQRQQRPGDAQQSPDKRPIRSVTEYIRSPAQLNKVRNEEGKQTKQQISAKNFFRKNEAQMVGELFRARVEQEMEDEVDEWKVVDYMGDLVRKAILKVQISEDEYVHLFAWRTFRGENWHCRYKSGKSKEDTLDQAEEDYEELPEQRICSERFDMNACSSGEVCSIM
eukprot:gb/GFBE01083442.1/.p1 GENE.gb/GFBE01083442.1/~~gb/GFBE01083442.1/.p1  ORF type:complete len:167 (+),score=43.05 gb/GFBE01083442.1/:1-501(+)